MKSVAFAELPTNRAGRRFTFLNRGVRPQHSGFVGNDFDELVARNEKHLRVRIGIAFRGRASRSSDQYEHALAELLARDSEFPAPQPKSVEPSPALRHELPHMPAAAGQTMAHGGPTSLHASAPPSIFTPAPKKSVEPHVGI